MVDGRTLRVQTQNDDPADGPPEDRGELEVTRSLCRQLRRRAKRGEVKAMAAEMGLSESTAWRHINDDCTHGGGVKVTPRRCGAMRAACHDVYTMTEVAERWSPVNASQTARHVRGDCCCDTGVKPVDGVERRKAQKSQCEAIRKAYEECKSYEKVARLDWVPITKGAVKYHVDGRCSCNELA